jgi:hypothetical protein
VDYADAASCAGLDCAIVPAKALMETLADREALARIALEAAASMLEPAQ